MYSPQYDRATIKYFTAAMQFGNILSKLTRDNDWWVLAYAPAIGRAVSAAYNSPSEIKAYTQFVSIFEDDDCD